MEEACHGGRLRRSQSGRLELTYPSQGATQRGLIARCVSHIYRQLPAGCSALLGKIASQVSSVVMLSWAVSARKGAGVGQEMFTKLLQPFCEMPSPGPGAGLGGSWLGSSLPFNLHPLLYLIKPAASPSVSPCSHRGWVSQWLLALRLPCVPVTQQALLFSYLTLR